MSINAEWHREHALHCGRKPAPKLAALLAEHADEAPPQRGFPTR